MPTRNYHIFTKFHRKALKLRKMSKKLSLEETGLSHDQIYLLRQLLKEY